MTTMMTIMYLAQLYALTPEIPNHGASCKIEGGRKPNKNMVVVEIVQRWGQHIMGEQIIEEY